MNGGLNCRKIDEKRTVRSSCGRSPYFASKTVSRVLYLTAIYLGALLPARSSHPGSGRASLSGTNPDAPIPVLLRIEFTAADCSQPPGALLPHLSTLTSPEEIPFRSVPPCGKDFARSIPSSSPHKNVVFAGAQFETENEAVYLCCTFPEVAFGGRYPLSLPCGARTFLMDGLSACPRGRLFYSQGHYTGKRRACQPAAFHMLLPYYIRLLAESFHSPDRRRFLKVTAMKRKRSSRGATWTAPPNPAGCETNVPLPL